MNNTNRSIFREKVALPSGLSLELSLSPPNSPPNDNYGGNKLAVLLHPWSRLGGNMNDPVLRFYCLVLQRRGFHVITYNSRGVGKSSGWPSFTGIQEGKDLQELVQWAVQYISDVRHVLIIGYSYGSLIASQHPVLSTIKTSHVLVSYPLDKRGLLTLFHSGTYTEALKSLIQHSDSRLLVLYGDRDEFTVKESYLSWAQDLRRDASEAGRQEDSLQVSCVEGATHFWGQESAPTVCEIFEKWLNCS